MSTSLIPESAPFTDEQRAWLNGFLAGWVGLDGAARGDGSSSARALVEQVAPADTPPAEAFPWHDDSLSMDERLKLADGKPLNRRLMAAMAQLDCGACGYLCQTYSEAIADGSEKSLTLCSPGGKETSKMLKKLIKEADAAGLSSTNGQVASHNSQAAVAQPSSGYTRANPFPAQIKQTYNLNGPGSAKYTSHVVIDLTGSDLEYRVGDALGVYPTNCPDLVDEILSRVDVSAGTTDSDKVRSALLTDYDLSEASEELVELLIAEAEAADEMEQLAELLRDDGLDDLDVLDVLQLASSAQISPTRLIELLSPLTPRLYSIASSPKAHPGEVHLTVAKVVYDLNGRTRKGVASTMFADRLGAGDVVRVFVHAASDFTVPTDPTTHMIMVGPGTGIAPFRAFLEERTATDAAGKNWLFFGDQHAKTDFLYQQELETMLGSGCLTRLETAFSRDQERKVYVQDRMLQHGRELFDWLEQGAYFYVCGDARRMAIDVDRTLHEVVSLHGSLTPEQSAEYVKQLRDSKRYVRDVY